MAGDVLVVLVYVIGPPLSLAASAIGVRAYMRYRLARAYRDFDASIARARVEAMERRMGQEPENRP